MANEMLTVIVSVFVATIPVGVAYGVSKKKDREAALRRERFAHYQAYVSCLTETREGNNTPEGRLAAHRASNHLNLVAPRSVIRALQAFEREAAKHPVDQEGQDTKLASLLQEMREDLRIEDRDQSWLSGAVRKLSNLLLVLRQGLKIEDKDPSLRFSLVDPRKPGADPSPPTSMPGKDEDPASVR
jgi:hypothetical protein